LEEPAIGPQGKVNGKYKDFSSECLKLFDCFIDIFTEGDFYSKSFRYPTHNVYCSSEWTDTFQDSFMKLINEIKTNQTPYLFNSPLSQYFNQKENNYSFNFFNYGILQKISINLPRIAFLYTDETKFIENVNQKFEFCAKILIKKYDIIKKRLFTNHLPLCNSIIEGNTLYQLKNQDLCIGFIGLNEAIKILTNSMMHETSDSLDLGVRIVAEMAKICNELSDNYQKKFTLIEDTSKKAIERFIKLDQRHFPQIQMNLYTTSSNFIVPNDLGLRKKIELQGKFHSLIAHGATERLSLKELITHYKSDEEILTFLNWIWDKTKVKCIKFIN
jgi:anaerobic ribonucleoside-triphosphate reductase